MQSFSAAFVLLLVLASGLAEAQVLEPPARPLFGGRASDPNLSQKLVFGLDFLGGFDENLAPDAGTSAAELTARPSGYTGLSIARLNYTFRRSARSLDVVGRSYMNTYSNIGLTPTYGGEVTVQGRSTLGRRGHAEIRQSVRYDPFLSLGAFSGLPAVTAGQAIDSNPTTAIAESRLQTNDTAVSVSHRWTQRTEFRVDYGFTKRIYQSSGGVDSRTHVGGFTYERSFGRSAGVRVSYRHSDVASFDLDNKPRTFQDHTADLGFQYGRSLSRTRRVSFSGGVGAVNLGTIDATTQQHLEHWAASGYSSAQIDLGRSWLIAGNYRRGVSVLQGLTPQPFFTDTLNLSVGGYLGARTDAMLTAASSSGHAGGQGQTAGRFRSYTATGQVRFAITQWWSTMFSYTRYQYKLDATASRALGGVAAELNRDALRVGVSLNLPLFGGK